MKIQSCYEKKQSACLFVFTLLLAAISGYSMQIDNKMQNRFEEDIIKTESGDLKITFIGHGTLMLSFNDMIIHIDPWTKLADYAALPKADLILITHDHSDHFDLKAIEAIRKKDMKIITPKSCAGRVKDVMVMNNGDKKEIASISIEAIPAYNLVHKRPDGQPFHPKGIGNGYLLTLGKKRIYIAGDTENIPEMKALKRIDVALLPMNLPYTMTPEMVADAAKAFQPVILYPYHFGDTDISQLTELLKDVKTIEVCIRKMK